jgi:hypothetical protein
VSCGACVGVVPVWVGACVGAVGCDAGVLRMWVVVPLWVVMLV